MKISPEQCNAAEIGYTFGRHLAILNPTWVEARDVEAKARSILMDLGLERLPSALVDRFETAIRNGFDDVVKGEDILRSLSRSQAQTVRSPKTQERHAMPVQSSETREVVGLLRKHGVEVRE